MKLHRLLKWRYCVLPVKRVADYPQVLIRKLVGFVRSKKHLRLKIPFLKMEQVRNEGNFISHLNMYQDVLHGVLSFGFLSVVYNRHRNCCL